MPNNEPIEKTARRYAVSMVANTFATETEPADALKILDDIRTGKWREPMEKIRVEFARVLKSTDDVMAAKAAVAQMKRQLPCALWSGEFTTRKKDVPLDVKLLHHSGLICADIDGLGDSPGEIRSKLITSPHVFVVFTSPTGSGLKVLFRVKADVAEHEASFRAVQQHVKELTGCEIDKVCSDVVRLCFVSYDPEVWIRPDEPLELEPLKPIGEMLYRDSGAHNADESLCPEPLCPASLHSTTLHPTSMHPEPLRPESLRPTSMHPEPLHPTSLHHSSDDIVTNVLARKQAMQILDAKDPRLSILYKDMIEKRFFPAAGERNLFITQAITFLYRAVAERLILVLVGHFYDCNRALFHDGREQHMREAAAMLSGVTVTYADSLSVDERKIYEALSVEQRDTFRICRDLAARKEPPHEAQTFFLSFDHLGLRLGIHAMQAQRIMRGMEGQGLLRLVVKGKRREHGVKSVAGTYKWLLTTPQTK